MLQDCRLQQTNRPLDVLLDWRKDGDGLYLTPPYQRGDVWGVKRRQNFIRSILLGVPVPSLIINHRLMADWPNDYRIAVIDGKQRITTVLMFVDGLLQVPGEWWGVDIPLVSYPDLAIVDRRKFTNKALPFSEGRLPDLAAEQMVFDLVNFGGLAQGESDIAATATKAEPRKCTYCNALNARQFGTLWLCPGCEDDAA